MQIDIFRAKPRNPKVLKRGAYLLRAREVRTMKIKRAKEEVEEEEEEEEEEGEEEEEEEAEEDDDFS